MDNDSARQLYIAIGATFGRDQEQVDFWKPFLVAGKDRYVAELAADYSFREQIVDEYGDGWFSEEEMEHTPSAEVIREKTGLDYGVLVVDAKELRGLLQQLQ